MDDKKRLEVREKLRKDQEARAALRKERVNVQTVPTPISFYKENLKAGEAIGKFSVPIDVVIEDIIVTSLFDNAAAIMVGLQVDESDGSSSKLITCKNGKNESDKSYVLNKGDRITARVESFVAVKSGTNVEELVVKELWFAASLKPVIAGVK